MLKTPLKYVERSLKTPIVMWFLMFFVYICLVLFMWPLYTNQQPLIYSQLTLFTLTVIFHALAMCKDPGHLKKPEKINFMQLMKIFDPVLLCADCEVVRTDRSRHCSICQRCCERFDHHCPWINNCVGLGNHGVFMSFLLSMLTLLILTFVSMIVNFSCWNNYSLPRSNDMWLYQDLFLPDFFYEKPFLMTITILCLIIDGTFVFLVS